MFGDMGYTFHNMARQQETLKVSQTFRVYT